MQIFFGADYYPEHWPEERWETDAELMEEMGLNVVRMAEFSWTKMEPRLGEFHFEWLDKAIELLGKHGVKTVLGTPTATPPAWIIEKNPEIFPVDSHSIRRGFGGRHHDCQSNETYRMHIKRFVTAMAEHFKDNANVIGWQIDNEFGNSHEDFCMCESCQAHFQSWLKEKYQTIENLNREWGTCFWSQDYDKFEQIPAPKLTAAGENPSAMLDWKRFCSDLIVDFQQVQIDIIREKCSNHFITHNFMGFADKVNYFDLGRNLDFISHDQYPGGFFREDAQEKEERLASTLDLMRGTKNQSFWIMEQQAGVTGWQIMGRAPKPGQLAMWAFQSIAHGADTVVFFRWRTCTVGTEQYWHGILPHSGKPSRRYYELKDFIAKMAPIMKDIQGAMPKNEVAIVYSYDQKYAFKIQPHHRELQYVDQVNRYYEAFYHQNIGVDFVPDTADFSQYQLVVAPLQYIMTPELEEKYKAYVKNGGRLILTMRTGVKNKNNVCMSEDDLPGKLSDLLGIKIADYDCLTDVNVSICWGEKCFEGRKWSDMIEPSTAETLATYGSEYYKGMSAITVNQFGAGKAYYVGTEPDEALMQHLSEFIVQELSLNRLGYAEKGVEFAERSTENADYLFVMNHTDQKQKLSVEGNWKPVLDQKSELLPFDFNIFKK
ncbi:beta-galactosidase [Scatolibacter rhodanostii]|uniref:beta-galactosidase n=1 Tax=Scatolibacter rhodanostii TaxID=2014781 RepID=UPI000C08AD61|nr:beta-galactosidase [Scatolibacter rhodanostii]